MSDFEVPDDLSEDAPAGRPDHPDFWKLSSIMLQLDAMAGEEPHRLDKLIASVVDEKSLAYMAWQRGIRGLLHQLHDPAPTSEVLAASWVEGFVIGVQWQKDRQEAEK